LCHINENKGDRNNLVHNAVKKQITSLISESLHWSAEKQTNLSQVVIAALGLAVPVVVGSLFGQTQIGIVASLGGLALSGEGSSQKFSERLSSLVYATVAGILAFILGSSLSGNGIVSLILVPSIVLIAGVIGSISRPLARVTTLFILFFIIATSFGVKEINPFSDDIFCHSWCIMDSVIIINHTSSTSEIYCKRKASSYKSRTCKPKILGKTIVEPLEEISSAVCRLAICNTNHILHHCCRIDKNYLAISARLLDFVDSSYRCPMGHHQIIAAHVSTRSGNIYRCYSIELIYFYRPGAVAAGSYYWRAGSRPHSSARNQLSGLCCGDDSACYHSAGFWKGSIMGNYSGSPSINDSWLCDIVDFWILCVAQINEISKKWNRR